MIHLQSNGADRKSQPQCLLIRRNNPVTRGQFNVTTNPAEVTCERCKKTRAYKALLQPLITVEFK